LKPRRTTLRMCLAMAMLAGLGWLSACQSTEVLSAHNLLGGEILTVSHGCGGFETLRNTTPPNTIAAARQSLSQSADAIELDVQRSADGQLIVFHDGRLENNTTCTGCIADLQSADLADCRYKTRHGSMDGNYPVPTLDSLLAAAKAFSDSALFFLNTKHDSPCERGPGAYPAFAEALSACVRRHDLAERVVIESLEADFLLAVREADPALRLLLDDEDYTRGMEKVRTHGFLGLAISNEQVTEAQVRQAHAEGYWLGIWGVKVQVGTRQAVRKGPEFIMTDDLLMLQANLKK
jgi:glycerophosphoryl diester phosphodiesterase